MCDFNIEEEEYLRTLNEMNGLKLIDEYLEKEMNQNPNKVYGMRPKVDYVEVLERVFEFRAMFN